MSDAHPPDAKKRKLAPRIEDETDQLQIKERRLQNIRNIHETMTMLDPQWKPSESLMKQINADVEKMFIPDATSAPEKKANSNALSISQIATNLNMSLNRGDIQTVGVRVRRWYISTYNEVPETNIKLVFGQHQAVNLYPAEVHAMIIDELKKQVEISSTRKPDIKAHFKKTGGGNTAKKAD